MILCSLADDRRVLKKAAAALGAFGLVPGAGLTVFFDPLRRKGSAAPRAGRHLDAAHRQRARKFRHRRRQDAWNKCRRPWCVYLRHRRQGGRGLNVIARTPVAPSVSHRQERLLPCRQQLFLDSVSDRRSQPARVSIVGRGNPRRNLVNFPSFLGGVPESAMKVKPSWTGWMRARGAQAVRGAVEVPWRALALRLKHADLLHISSVHPASSFDGLPPTAQAA
jgi:hypothetical protein